MLINLERLVEPISRGLLVDDAKPDYPPLIDACDGARQQGGLVLWCHNGQRDGGAGRGGAGRARRHQPLRPVLDGPRVRDLVRLLNCGLRLPASTGSDWFVCSSNRVYVDVGGALTYQAWLAGLRAGRTFITDGPILRLTVAGHAPSNDVLAPARGTARSTWSSSGQRPSRSTAIEIVRDGDGRRRREETRTRRDRGRVRTSIDASVGWVAARAWGRTRNSYDHALWAHTSPVYVRDAAGAGDPRDGRHAAFIEDIDRSLEWITTQGAVRCDVVSATGSSTSSARAAASTSGWRRPE